MSPDRLQLLGTFQLVHHGQQVTLGQPRLEELTALLAAHPGASTTRTQLAYHFWPDSSERQARTNARNLLYKLKNRWPNMDEVVIIGRAHVTWRRDAAVGVDLFCFEELHVSAEACEAGEARVRLLINAASYYRGDFLPGCYADWALARREALRTRYAALLEQLVDTLLDLRRHDEALGWAKKLRGHDPLQESTYRRLMQTYALLGDRSAALRVYHSCASILQKELGVEPSSATLQLHAQLLQGQPTEQQQDEPHVVPRPRLVGRNAEWQQLRQVWGAVQQGQAHAVLIWGEAGIGKTRLAEEIIDWVRRQGHAWASSRSYAAEGALTYAPITEWLHAPSVRPALDATDDLRRVELARILPELLVERPDLPPPGPLSESWQQQRFFQGIVHTLSAVPGPLLLHLDDMQWSDQETLTLLQFLLHGARNHPLLLVGTIRTEDADGNGPLAAFVAALRHDERLTEMRLAPLSRREAGELAEQAADASISSEMADALYATSEGHPLFLIETVHSRLGEAAMLHPDQNAIAAPSKQANHSPIPSKIYSLLSMRLAQLSPEARQAASAAAVIGRKFTYRVLQGATSMDELPLVDALDELWRRRLIREQDGDSYDFSHDRIREVAYQEISRARRRLLHRRVAAALETIHGDDLDEVVGELAAHYAQEGDSTRACRYYHRAAKVAQAKHALADATAKFDAALAHAEDDPVVRFQLLAEQNVVLSTALKLASWRNNLDEQKALLASLSGEEPHLVFEFEIDQARYFGNRSEGKAAVEAASAALAIAERLGDKAAMASSYQEMAHGYWAQARMAEAKPLFGQAVAYARQVGDRRIEATSLEMHAASGMFSGMPTTEIHDRVTQAFQLAEANQDKQKMSTLLNKFGYLKVSTGMGDFGAAEDEYERGLALAREIGDRRIEEILLSNLGVCLTNKGDYRRASKTLDACLALGDAYPTYWRHLTSRHYRAALLMQMGRLYDASVELVHVCEQMHQFSSPHFEVKARCDLGLLYHLAGEDRLAQEELAHVLTLIKGHGDLRFEALVCTRLGYALEACDQLGDAVAMYERGRDLHTQMGQTYYALNALAGSARVAERQGHDAVAYAQALMIWDTIAGKEMDASVETVRTLRTCYTIFLERDEPRAADILDAATAQLRQRADTIDDPAHVAQFWQLADHRFFQKTTASQD